MPHNRRYRVDVTHSAEKEILRLHPKIRRQVEATIHRLLVALNTGQRPQDMAVLEGEPDGFRVDSGEYRLLFYLNDADGIVKITRVRHRKDVYRNL